MTRFGFPHWSRPCDDMYPFSKTECLFDGICNLRSFPLSTGRVVLWQGGKGHGVPRIAEISKKKEEKYDGETKSINAIPFIYDLVISVRIELLQLPSWKREENWREPFYPLAKKTSVFVVVSIFRNWITLSNLKIIGWNFVFIVYNLDCRLVTTSYIKKWKFMGNHIHKCLVCRLF